MGAAQGVIPLLERGGVLVAAALVATAFAARSPRACALAMLGGLALAPALLALELARTGRLDAVGGLPPLAWVAAVAGLLLVAALARVLVLQPELLPVLAVAALPFRVPVAIGGLTANLLVPLYGVVAAGVLAHAWRVRAPRARRRVLERGPGLVPLARRRVLERPPGLAELALVGALALYAAQSLYSADFPKALETIVFFYVPFALLLRLLVAVPWSRRVVVGCLGAALVLAVAFVLVGFWEYVTRRLLLNPKVIASNQFESYFRVNSLFFDPNIYGRFLVMVMLGLCGVLLWARRADRAVQAALGLALLWAGLLLTFSQSSFAALLVGLAVLAGLRWRARPAALAGLLAGLVAAAAVVLSPGLAGFQAGTGRSLDEATSGRFELVRGGVAMWLDRPLLGYGSGSFSRVFREREEVSSQEATVASHTIPVTVAAEQGVVGLAAYAVVLLAAFGLTFGGLPALGGRSRATAVDAARAVVAAAFAALVVHTLLYAAFLEDPLTWTLLGAARGLTGAVAPSGRAVPARTRTGSSSP
jgi:O-antigen ligase